MLSNTVELTALLFFLALFSFISYKKKLLDFEGILIGNAVGLAAITYGPNPLIDFGIVVVFFVIGEVASNFPKKKHEERNIWNVIGNSLPALITLLPIIVFPENSFLFELAFFGAISAALADTLSSEIGYYSKSKPIMITTLKPVARGTDGGVTLLGEGAALFGGLIIGLVHFFVYQNYFLAGIIVLAGVVGSNSDSIAGGLFETKKILNNTQVNMIGSACGAIFCFILGLLLI
ncbi:MAG: DUF92 domain-containing protein [Candidatus ainarchaeum sp.]|nr:DUF92 domain-containing protein [Candidatus ainarchaeum sp.]MDD3085652.1 DUF92 domain-containing protein [Candidatus ainarchaeum sp.]MDD4468066.1 DUF92 domain-containing protein [Candidatus ainarchaeum sp.]HPM85833.1 DUF92 domain-containing protein [archaeon]